MFLSIESVAFTRTSAPSATHALLCFGLGHSVDLNKTKSEG